MSILYFGNIETFAIRYIPGYKLKNRPGWNYATCHLILENEIIGFPDETCLLNTWMLMIEDFKEKIATNFENLFHPEFEYRTDAEIFELISKSNQLEEDFDLKYLYLPILENSVWQNCAIRLDETIDAYFLQMIKHDDTKIKFLWKKWRHTSTLSNLNTLKTVIVEKDLIINTINECIVKIEEDSQSYPFIR